MFKKISFTLFVCFLGFFLLSGCAKYNSSSNDNSNKKLKTESKLSTPILIIPKIVDSDIEWDKSLMNDISNTPIIEEGFLSKPKKKKWILQVINTEDKNINEIKINYSIRTYKHNITFGEDKTFILGYTPWNYKEVHRELFIPSINSGEYIDIDIFSIGTFPMAKLIIHEILLNDSKIDNFKEFTVSYHDNEFDSLQDSQHLRELLGL